MALDRKPLDRPVLIATAPRSGSSMVAGIIHANGVWGGEVRKGDGWNRKGYFENIELNRLLVRTCGECVRENRLAEPKSIKKEVQDILNKQDYPGGPWFYKFSALYFKPWQDFNPIWVTVRRDTRSIEKSGLRSRKNANIQSIPLHEEALDHLESLGGHRIWTPDIINGDYSAFKPLFEELGMTFKIPEGFVNKKLWNYAY